jgi:hypothetical protein
MNKNKEFSKRLLTQTRYIFIASLIAACVFAWQGKDTSVFMYIIPSTGGAYGAAIVFYLNKAKMETKLNLMMKYPSKHHEEIESELSKIDAALDSKIDSTMNEAIQEDISIQNF